MNDGAHIGTVDAHAKGIGCHHHFELTLAKGLGDACTVIGAQACVIARDGPALIRQAVRFFLRKEPPTMILVMLVTEK